MISMNQDGLPRSDARNAWDLMEDVIACVEQEPKRLDMSYWMVPRSRIDSVVPPHMRPACGWVGCVAGWILVLRGRHHPVNGLGNDIHVGYAASKELGVDNSAICDLFSAAVDSGDDDEARSLRVDEADYVPMVIRKVRRFMRDNENQLRGKELPTNA